MAWADELAAKMGATLASPRTSTSHLRMLDGRNLYNSYGGGGSQVRASSYKTVVNACAGHNQYFPTNYAANIQFATINAIDGHTSTNACVELRHAFGQVLRSNGSWEFAYHSAPMYGKRLPNGDLSFNVVPGSQRQLPGGVLRIQPGPTPAVPGESNPGIWGYEVWPSDWDGSGNAIGFYGRVDKGLYQDAQCYVVGLQARLALWDETKADDRASSFFVIQTGFDLYSVPSPGARYIDDAGRTYEDPGYGYPYKAMDGPFGPWQRIVPGDWQWFVCVCVTELGAIASSIMPPWGAWGSGTWPYVTPGDESITEAQFYANPPPAPPGASVPEEPPPTTPEERLPLPSTGRWFPRLTSSENTWASKSFATTPASKIRRRRGAKLWS